MQIRQDFGMRYVWASSKGRFNGVSSGAPLHIARPWRCKVTGRAFFTEGGLKVDFIADLTDECVIAVAGVTAIPRDFVRWLRANLPSLRLIRIAFDADWETNPAVRSSILRAIRILTDANFDATVIGWDIEQGKGFDDFLSKGGRR